MGYTQARFESVTEECQQCVSTSDRCSNRLQHLGHRTSSSPWLCAPVSEHPGPQGRLPSVSAPQARPRRTPRLSAREFYFSTSGVGRPTAFGCRAHPGATRSGRGTPSACAMPCSVEIRVAAPAASAAPSAQTESPCAAACGGDAEEGAETYTGGEASSPVRFTATSPDGEQVEVQLLGMADIKAKGMTDTAWLPQTRYDEAQEWLDKIVGGEQLTLIEDPASPEDTTEDGALLRYVDSTGTSAQSISGSDNDDVAMGLFNLYAGVADNDEKWSGLERYDEYVEASLTAEERNGGLLGENELVAVNEDGSGYEYSK